MHRTSYDTSIKHLIRLGLTDVIPNDLLLSIPSSNINRWKNESDSKYLGSELNEIAKEKYELLRKFSKSQKAQKILSGYFQLVKICQLAINVSSSTKKVFHSSKEQIVDCIQKVKPVLGLKKVVQFLGISVGTFHNWLLETKVKCEFSYFHICNRLRPNQLTKQEVMTLKNLLLDERFKYWPVSSIAYYAQREGILSVGLSTFYKYAKLLGVSRPKYIKPKSPIGIRADSPNQLWHGDITIFSLNNVKYYLYFLIDNYSRFILGHYVSTQKSGVIWKKILADAIEKYKPNNAQLLVDDGSENNNVNVDELLKQKPETLQKFIAQKDISFSNSMVEALNKIVKNNYLRIMNIHSGNMLAKMVDFVVYDYCIVRPHGSLNGSTPYEVFNNAPWDKSCQSELMKLAKEQRIAQNQRNQCRKCW